MLVSMQKGGDFMKTCADGTRDSIWVVIFGPSGGKGSSDSESLDHD